MTTKTMKKADKAFKQARKEITSATKELAQDLSKLGTKKPAPKESKKAPGAREIIPGDAKLTVLAKENPRRGDLAAKTFALYSKAKTVGEFRELCKDRGGDAGYLHADIRAGHVKVG
jgi:hypothetical protein